MNDMNQGQQSSTQHIAGVIHNFKQVPTRTGKKMAVFTIDDQPAKCFDLAVEQAEQWANSGKQVSITGQLSSHNGQTELVAQTISPAPPGQTHTRTGSSQPGYTNTSAANKAPLRESGMIVENLSGCVSDVRALNTHSGKAMITFTIGKTQCKAFGDLASAIVKADGKHIQISARKGSYQGVTEYAVEVLKTLEGNVVNLRDNQPIRQGSTPAKLPTLAKAIDPPLDSDTFEAMLRGVSGPPRPQSSEGVVTIFDQQTPIDPGQNLSGSADDEVIQQRMQSQQAAPTGEASPRKPPEIEGVISKIQHVPGCNRSTTTFRIGEQIVVLHDKAAEFVARHASEYKGKSIALAGEWKRDENERKAFVPEYSLPAVEPGSDDEITAQEVEKGLKRALLNVVYVRHGLISLVIDEELEATRAA